MPLNLKALNSVRHILCRACRRRLRNRHSQKVGLGPCCARKFRQIVAFEQAERAGQMRLPGVLCR